MYTPKVHKKIYTGTIHYTVHLRVCSMANPKILTLDIQYTVYSYNSAYTYSNMTILKYEKVYSKHIQLCMQYTVKLISTPKFQIGICTGLDSS